MALDNLISVQFTDEELTKLNEALTHIEEVLSGKTINLTPEQRMQYGAINEENKLLVNKVADTEANHPQHHPAFLDKAEFEKDYKARTQIESVVERMEVLTQQFKDTKILLDHDNMQYSVSYYRYIKLLGQQNVPGANAIYQHLREVYASKLRKAQQKATETATEKPTEQS